MTSNGKWILNTPEARKNTSVFKGLEPKYVLGSALALLLVPISAAHAAAPSECSNVGNTRYNSTDKRLEFCDGEFWIATGIGTTEDSIGDFYFKGRLFLVPTSGGASGSCPANSTEIDADTVRVIGTPDTYPDVPLCFDGQGILQDTGTIPGGYD